jgi:predicted HicB family RNase H-like nuclease
MNTAQNTVTLRAKRDRKAKTPWKQMTIRIPHDVHKALKIRAAEEERAVGEVVERLIREYLVKGARREIREG